MKMVRMNLRNEIDHRNARRQGPLLLLALTAA